jgi:chaperonin GroEL (HSP60 family)
MAAGQFGGTPVLILKEGSQRTAGREAQRSNIMAAKAVAGAVRTTLGPKGMDKMMVDTLGDVVITNDGVTILKEMDIEHPAAKMMVEIAKTQDAEVGDGTTTAVVLAGELLKQAEGLLDQEIHPTVTAAGYRAAADKAMEILKTIAVDVSVKDAEFLKKIAVTAMTGKGSGTARDELANLAVEAVRAVVDEDGSVDTDNITVEKKVGGGITDSELVHGMVIDKDRLHPNMPKKSYRRQDRSAQCCYRDREDRGRRQDRDHLPRSTASIPGSGREHAQGHGGLHHGHRR